MIYLDHAASAPPGPELVRARAAADALTGSPAAVHEQGRGPAELLERARDQLATLINGNPDGVIFTSGATEARNLALKGLWSANRRPGDALVISAVEHPAVRSAALSLQRGGATLVEVGVDNEGRIDPSALGAALGDETRLVSLTLAQGDIGTLQDGDALVATVRARCPDARVHLDAGDCVGRIDIDCNALDCDALSVGGWPLGAPPWSGALWVRPGAGLHPLIEGGIQEHGKRSGAENLPAIAMLGAAAAAVHPGRTERLAELGQRLIAGLLTVEGVRLNGPRTDRIPGHVQVAVGDVEAETLVAALSTRGVAASPGSACTAYAGKAAPALEAIGLEAPWTQSAALFTLGETTTEDEIDRAIVAFAEVVATYRAASPLAR